MNADKVDTKLLYGEESKALTECEICNKQIRVHRLVKTALLTLTKALENAGLSVVIVSHWRTFLQQATIWNEKWEGLRPVLDRKSIPLDVQTLSDQEKFESLCFWSAVPGTSRHHWGTDFDIFLKSPIDSGYKIRLIPDEFSSSGVCGKLEEWMREHLEEYGFYRPYQTQKGGVFPEPWHISHRTTATECLNQLKATEVAQLIMQHQLHGGEIVCQNLEKYFQNYVYNID